MLRGLCICVCLSVFLLVTTVSPTKADKQIEIPFGVWTPLDPLNHVLGGKPDALRCRAILGNYCVKQRDYTSEVDILNLIRQVAATMRPFAVSIAATCYY